MKKYNTILNFLSSHISRYDFNKIVCNHDGDKGIRTLTTENLFKVMLYAQITKAFSLHEIVKTLDANGSKLYHSGMVSVKKSTIADALSKRKSNIFEDIFQHLLRDSKSLYRGKRRFRNPLQLIDASTIDLCLSRFDWAHFRKSKGAVKLHVSYDSDSHLPNQVFFSTGNKHESKTLLDFDRKPGDILVFDKGYNSYKSFWQINLSGGIFVSRLKRNAIIKKKVILEKSHSDNIISDSYCTINSPKGKIDYPGTIRIVEYLDPTTKKRYQFLTNDLDRPAQEIADIYKERWQIELFFKWIKQNLKIKTFFGTSENAVWSQIWIALILYLLIWMIKNIYALEVSMQRILQILKTTLFDRCHISDLFKPPPLQRKDNSLPLFEGIL